MASDKIDVKIGTPELDAWTKIKEGAEKEIEVNKRMIIVNQAIVKAAEEQIKKCM